MNFPTLGIMTCRKNNLFSEKEYFKLLQKFGDKNKIKTFVFYPDFIDINKKKVTGYRYDFQKKEWKLSLFPFPNFIYDRCFYNSKLHYKTYKPYVNFLKKQRRINFLGIGLKGKWEVHQILSSDTFCKDYVPKTEKFTNTEQLIKWLNISPVILKPSGGSHGKGIVKITYVNKKFEVIGRNCYNNKIHHHFKNFIVFNKWILTFTKNRHYLLQEYLNLTTSKNIPFDIRILIQKNYQGNWEITGSAARVGESSNITSNLHGGGKVESTSSLLIKEFGESSALNIEEKITKLGDTIPALIEAHHGNLFELGLDIGIDKQGKIWIIEVNSKPGRRIFTLLKDKNKNFKSITQPILYTKYLTKKLSNK